MLKHKTGALIALIGIVALFGAAGCAKKAAGDSIKIGVFEPLTGPNAAGGAQEVEGIELAAKLRPTVNVAGKTYKVDIVLLDNKSDKVEAANAVQRLIDQGAQLILGSWGSSLSIAAGGIVKDSQVPAIGISCTNPLVTKDNDWYFRICFIDPFQGAALADYAYNKMNAKTACIVQEVSNDYSVGLAKYFIADFTKLGGKILCITNYNTGDQDFNAQLSQVKSMNPDVVFAPGNFTESALLIQQARQLGMETTPFLGGDTWDTPIFLTAGKEQVVGATLSSFFDASEPINDASKTFVQKYKEMRDELPHHQKVGDIDDSIPSANTALGFDVYNFALDAFQRAGTITDEQRLRDTIAKTKGWQGVTGVTTLDANGDATKDVYFKTVAEGPDGALSFKFITVVEPVESAKARANSMPSNFIIESDTGAAGMRQKAPATPTSSTILNTTTPASEPASPPAPASTPTQQ
jgi:branched-chain amino acid transport system substrate-binding protein